MLQQPIRVSAKELLFKHIIFSLSNIGPLPSARIYGILTTPSPPHRLCPQGPFREGGVIRQGSQGTQKACSGDGPSRSDGKPQEDKGLMKEISKKRAGFLAGDYSRGFIKHCRIEATAVRWGFFESRVAIDEHHRQQDGFIHAGVMATMADHTAGYSAFTTVAEAFQILTIEFKINFLRPAYGNALICRSRVIREGSRIIISESEVYDVREGGEALVAKALVTLMAVHRDRIASKG
jgi:uncharacterized protein (TIGR00369 family)